MLMQLRSIGGIKETREMLNFCAGHGVQPEIEMTSVQHINGAWERVEKSAVKYRFVIDNASVKRAWQE